MPIKILANHITSTLIELLRWWLQFGGQYTPQQMEQCFFALIGYDIIKGETNDAEKSPGRN
jgi:hypothetical protein